MYFIMKSVFFKFFFGYEKAPERYFLKLDSLSKLLSEIK